MSSHRIHACLSFTALVLIALPLFLAAGKLAAEENTQPLHGRVRDSQGLAVARATVTVKETGDAVVTDNDGAFTVQAPNRASLHLVFSAPGYFLQTVMLSSQYPTEIEVVLARSVLVKEEVSVTAPRLDIPLAQNPAAMSIVPSDALDSMPRTVAAEEALAPVPGMKIDNQANQERVHVSIRGQGILSEHGVRGIEVLLDGVPLADPSGFVSDLFDVDWANVQEITVMRGPVASLYGGGSSGGVIDIATRTATGQPHATFAALGGSNDFYKGHADYSRRIANMPLFLSAARAASAGYRVHTSFYGDNVSGKFSLNTSHRLQLNFLALGTGYFNQNPEGLNLSQVQQDPRQANPDALTYNEYQKTKRGTGGITGLWTPTEHQRVSFTALGRYTHYDESVPSSVDHQDTGATGGLAQYDAEVAKGRVVHHFSLGVDQDGQWTNDFRHPNLGGGTQTPELLANQDITEKRSAGFAAERLELGSKWSVLANARWDHIGNLVKDHLKADGLDLSGERTFNRATGRVGLTFSPKSNIGFYAAWGQGFLPPATEELYANPDALGGFNVHLKPATSWGVEGGVRGAIRNNVYYQASFFHLDTANDFERYRIASRPLETFYGNAGKTSRYGFESELRWTPISRMVITGAYTYSHFIYTNYDSSVYPGDLTGNRLPNSPNHQVFLESTLELPKGLRASINTQAYSRAYIDPTNAASIGGYDLLNARLSRQGRCGKFTCELSIFGRNLAATHYIAFTEPDPDGNSYQPGTLRELFGGLTFHF
jgi:iron complex outermembrane recepter protein